MHAYYIKICGEIEMGHFDGRYNLLLNEFRTVEQLYYGLNSITDYDLDEQLVIYAFAWTLGLLDIRAMPRPRQRVIEYVSDRHHKKWHHLRRLALYS